MRKVCLIIFVSFFLFIPMVYGYDKTLEDGIYTISSAANSNYSLDVSQGIAKNQSNIQIYSTNFSNAQKFKVSYLEDGYYEILSLVDNNYSLDVSGGKFLNASNIQLYSSNKSNAQKWILKKNGESYYILTIDGKYALDIANGIIKNFSNIWLYQYNGSNAQKFKFNKIEEGSKTIENGLYTISSALNQNKVLNLKNGDITNYNDIQLYDFNGTDAQKWLINYIGNGLYTIKPYASINYSVDVYNGSHNIGTKIQLFKYNNSNAQKWIIKDLNDGYFSIISICNNLNVDVAGANTANGSKIQLYTSNNTNAQKFQFNPVKEFGSRSLKDGYYFINTSLNNKKVLDINNGVIADGINVQIFDINYSLAQKWYIKYIENGYYSILSDKDNNYALEYDDSGNVRINSYQKLDNQKWIIKKNSNNYYIIADNGMYLDLSGGSSANTTNIGLYNFNGTNAQKFNFIKTASGISENVLKNGIYRIASSLDKNKFIDLFEASTQNKSNIQLYQSNATNAQKWVVEYLSNGYYKISSLINMTKVWDVSGGAITNETNLQLYDNNDSIAQQWIIKDVGNGYYNIISNCGGLYVDVAGAKTSNETNIWMYTDNDSKAQKFRFIKSDQETKVIDVSSHQGKIDWDKVYNSGIYGVILRIGAWTNEDSRFSEYIKEVKRLEIPYGIYLFSYASSDDGINKEIQFTKSMIDKYNLKPILGIYYDIEDWYTSPTDSSDLISKDRYDVIIGTYINSISSHVSNKFKVKVYANLYYANNKFNDYARSQIDWIAQYNNTCSYTGNYSLWQFTSSATLDGIKGYVDMSYLY